MPSEPPGRRPGRPVGARPALLSAMVAVLTVAGLLTAAPPAAAEGYPRPSGTTLELAGRGFGHGRGMSQWGAYGAAAGPARLTWQRILAFYYPGTVLAQRATRSLRVRLDQVGTGPTMVAAGGGLTLRAASCTVVLPTTSAVITYWRVRRSSATTFALEFFNSSPSDRSWHPWTPRGSGCPAAATTPEWTFSATGNVVRVLMPGGSVRSYRGVVRAIADPASSTGQRTLNDVDLEAYTKSVVPSEMPASWAAEALKAQAVAARTYAARRLGASAYYDICDTQQCQVYSGTSTERSTSSSAVDATRGQVLTYGGQLALTEFSAYNGGWTSAGSLPYQVAKRDPYDGVFATPAATWRSSIALSSIEAAYPSIGRLQSVQITQRTGNGSFGGAVEALVLAGSAGRVSLSGSAFRSRFDLRSAWFTIVNSASSAHDFTGDGLGDLIGRSGSTGDTYAYAGNAAGGYTARIDVGNLSGYSELVVQRDVDGDGLPDLLARNDATGALVLFAGDGRGGIGAGRSIGTGWGGYSQLTAVPNFDGDGAPDLVARENATGYLWLYRGDGRGGWLSRRLIGRGWQSVSELVSVDDWDGDGYTDLIARNDPTGRLYLFRGNGRGGWAGVKVIGYGWSGYSRLAGPGDWTGDGRPDLLAVNRSDGTLYAYRGDGRGGWLARVKVGTGWGGIDTVVS